MHDLIARALLLLLPLIVLLETSSMSADPESSRYNLFARKLLPIIVKNKLKNNIVYSPSAIYNFLALTYLKTEGRPAEEIRKALNLNNRSEIESFLKYDDFLADNFVKETKRKNTGSEPSTTYNVYIRRENLLREETNEWVVRSMNNKTQNLIRPNLINSIYFKADWLSPTPHFDQQKEGVLLRNYSKYAELNEINAIALELPYKNTDITIMAIQPIKTKNFKTLVNKLKYIDLNDISSKMKPADLDTFVPKFRLKFEMDMSEPLRRLGISLIFKNANTSTSTILGNLPTVKHKAFFEHNQNGSVAAASTYADTSNISYSPKFCATHPFVFFIRSKTVVYFAGHIVKLP